MFERLKILIGEDNLNKIHEKTVLVIGVGGVGGHAVTSLVRSGIKNIIIVDYDIIDITNLNRQIIATNSTIGKKKIDVLEQMILDINDSANVIKYDLFLNEENIDEIFSRHEIDYVVDACDAVNTKKAIISKCIRKKIPFISSMGTGNRMDPTQIRIIDIRKTNNDPLAKIIRKWVRDNKINGKIPVVSSLEVPKKVGKIVGSNSFVPASAGLVIASYVINEIIK